MSLEGFVHFIPLEWSNDPSDKSSTDFYPKVFKNSSLHRACLLRIVTQPVNIPARLLPSKMIRGEREREREREIERERERVEQLQKGGEQGFTLPGPNLERFKIIQIMS